MILIGGLLMVFSLNGKITEEQQKRDLETSIAKLLVSDYEGVKTIKFQGWGHSRETGSWGTTVIINSENRMSLSFDRLSGLKEISGSSYHPDTFKLVEKSGIEELEPIMYRVRDIEKVSLKGIRIIHSAE
ncbi:membrane protein [Streptococcus equi subsp. zooepidemicus]|nr:membrane protein [Streptococcus equi subsp. zooepidemicus]